MFKNTTNINFYKVFNRILRLVAIHIISCRYRIILMTGATIHLGSKLSCSSNFREIFIDKFIGVTQESLIVFPI